MNMEGPEIYFRHDSIRSATDPLSGEIVENGKNKNETKPQSPTN